MSEELKKPLVLSAYHEHKEHYAKRIVWFFVQRIVFRFLVGLRLIRVRSTLLKWFGAQTGKWSLIYPSVDIYAPWNLEMGEAGCIGPRVTLYNKGKITLGQQVTISQDAYLCTASHDFNSRGMEVIIKPIVIGDLAWIASRATILPGVTIGEGAVVGACAVVAKDVEPWTVVAGNPARVVGRRCLK